jgi:hypothetical protein
MTHRLVNQFETDQADSGGRFYGFERFYDDAEGYWSVRFHCRIYDGIKVAHSHSTEEIRLEGDTPEELRAAMWQAFSDFLSAYRTGAE